MPSPNFADDAAIFRGESTPAIPAETLAKQKALLENLRQLDSLLIAYSGGADSGYLAWAAHTALGPRALAVTAISPSFSSFDREQAEKFARETGLHHEWIETREFENSLYVANGADRCYHCKDELFSQMARLARERSFAAIAYGINSDDTRDFRPGHRAAAEHKVLAPLLAAHLTKAEIRLLSRRAGLSTWDRPAAACLSSRVPYGTAVTPELLERIERGEAVLRALGFRQLRVRAHGELARIEVAREEMPRVFSSDIAQQIVEELNRIGFAYVTLDLEGYRRGSFNIFLREH